MKQRTNMAIFAAPDEKRASIVGSSSGEKLTKLVLDYAAQLSLEQSHSIQPRHLPSLQPMA